MNVLVTKAVGWSQNVRLRSANRGNANNTWNVNSSGNVNNNNAYNANRFSPDCAVSEATCPIHRTGAPLI